jgi:hypothetical protein
VLPYPQDFQEQAVGEFHDVAGSNLALIQFGAVAGQPQQRREFGVIGLTPPPHHRRSAPPTRPLFRVELLGIVRLIVEWIIGATSAQLAGFLAALAARREQVR